MKFKDKLRKLLLSKRSWFRLNFRKFRMKFPSIVFFSFLVIMGPVAILSTAKEKEIIKISSIRLFRVIKRVLSTAFGKIDKMKEHEMEVVEDEFDSTQKIHTNIDEIYEKHGKTIESGIDWIL